MCGCIRNESKGTSKMSISCKGAISRNKYISKHENVKASAEKKSNVEM